MKKGLSLLVAGVMVATAFTACSNTGSSANSDTIVIGGLAPLTGSVSQYGISTSNGAKLAIKEINEAGGILGKQVDFVLYDEKGDAVEAVTQYDRLVQKDNIVALIGDITTKPTIAVAQKAAQDNIPMITPTGTGASITEIGNNIFRACFTDPFQGELMANYATDKLGAKTAAVLYDTGDDYSTGIAEAFKQEAGTLGLEVVAYEGYTTGSTDFNAQLTKIKSVNPDVIMVPCYYQDASQIIVQARKMGITSQFLGSDGWDGVLQQLDPSNYEYLNDSFYCNQYSLGQPSEALQKFIDAYTTEYGADTLSMFAVLGYESAYIMAAAIENAGSTDSDAIVAALKNLDYQGVSGSISYKGGNDPVREVYMIEFVDGKEEILGTYTF